MRLVHHSLLVVLVAVTSALSSVSSSFAARIERSLPVGPWRTLHYVVVTPDGDDPTKPAPTMLLVPSGVQDRAAVDAALLVVADAAARRGWVVVCPEAVKEPLGRASFADDGFKYLRPLVAAIRAARKLEGNQLHVAGIGSGGRAAMRLGLESPADCASLYVFPGAFPGAVPTDAALVNLAPLPVRMVVGGRDEASWVDASQDAVAALKRAGVDARLEVRAGEGHVIGDLTGDEIFDVLDAFRPGHGSAEDKMNVDATLNALYEAARDHDESRYFALFAPDAVFIGTDAAERWTIDQFRAYAAPIFAAGKGWSYAPRDRHVTIDDAAGYAFFDELLDNPKYGECRGTGVLRRVGARPNESWKIVQYHLTMPVPNDLLAEVARQIAAKKQAAPAPK
ncbi:MAG: nuclear transport factor 2 family protein [Phycisphaerales bacterium]